MTARQLAPALGVSERTVLRDVTALAEADIPVFAEQGRYGGIVLLPGARLDVSRLTPSEVDALHLLGLDPAQTAQLGIDTATTQRKLSTGTAPTPPTIPLSQLVVIDNRGWFEAGPIGADPASLARDLQSGRRLKINYRRSAERTARRLTVDPYGLLARAGRWYLVADHRRVPGLFALARLAGWEILDQPRRLRPDVDLFADHLMITDPPEAAIRLKELALITAEQYFPGRA